MRYLCIALCQKKKKLNKLNKNQWFIKIGGNKQQNIGFRVCRRGQRVCLSMCGGSDAANSQDSLLP